MTNRARQFWENVREELDATKRSLLPLKAWVVSETDGKITVRFDKKGQAGKQKFPKLAGPQLSEGQEVMLLPYGENEYIALPVQTGSYVVTPGGIDAEQARDIMAAFLNAGANISIVHNDAADTLTISVTGLTKSTVGLGNVDNTSDLAKPISTAVQTALDGKAASSHTHTPAQVGLGNVNNTSDLNKPVSTATQTALNAKLNTSDAPELIRDTMGTALIAGANVIITVNDAGDTITIAATGGGGGGLVVSGTKITPVNADRMVILDSADSLAGKSTRLDELVVNYLDSLYMRAADITTALAGKAATAHTHTKAQVGLANVDNTSDAAKPISTATQTALDGKASTTHSHTKADVGLGNVDNTSDAAKPISTATQTALNGKANSTHMHSMTHVSGLNDELNGINAAIGTLSSGKADAIALTSHTGDTSNPHSTTKAQVGLGNVDNTSDAAKPISTATQTALNGKANTTHTHTIANVTNLQTTLDGKAPAVHTHTYEEVLQVRVYNGGVIIPSDIVGDVIIPYDCAPVSWTMLTPEVSTAVIELWKDTLANYPPTSADKISSTFRINTNASKYGQGSNVSSWNTDWNKDEVLRIYVASNNVATEMFINVYVTRVI